MHCSNSLTDSHRSVGILGGTFDPPHLGHLMLAERACHAFQLDSVVFVVANQPWQKVGSRSITTIDHRLKMTKIAVSSVFKGLNEYIVSDVERVLGGDSYTSKTLSYFREKYPTNSWYPIIGSDVAHELNTWHNARYLRESTVFLVAQRGEDQGKQIDISAGWKYKSFTLPANTFSSSSIRKKYFEGEDIEKDIPESVAEYIRAHTLYTVEDAI